MFSFLSLFITGTNAQYNVSVGLDKNVEVLKNTTNELVDSSYVSTDMGSWTRFCLELKLSGGVSCKVFVTLDNVNVSNTNEAGWVNCNTYLFAADSIYNVHNMYVKGLPFSPQRLLLKFRNTDDTNSNKVIISKYK